MNSDNEYYIVLLYLRPKISNDIQGEKIHLTCEFSIGNSKEDGMFNVVSTCSYGNTVDYEKMEKELEKKIQALKDENVMTQEEIGIESKNWKLLEGLRYFKKNSFDFIIQTVGVFENSELIIKACDIIIEKINKIENKIQNNTLIIEKTLNTTMQHCYDIRLENEDYTIGNILKYILYKKFYEEDPKLLTFCGFKKFHPHDHYSVVRLAYKEHVEKIDIISNLQVANSDIIDIFNKMKDVIHVKETKKKNNNNNNK